MPTPLNMRLFCARLQRFGARERARSAERGAQHDAPTRTVEPRGSRRVEVNRAPRRETR